MQDRRLLPTDWVTRLKAAQIKCEQLKTDFPKESHPEEAVKAIYRQHLTSEEIVYRDVKEVFTALTQ